MGGGGGGESQACRLRRPGPPTPLGAGPVSVAYGQERIQRGRMRSIRVCILTPAIFKNVFDVFNFSIISYLFDSYKLYALSTHNQTGRTKCIIFGEALRNRVKKFNHKMPENYSKSTKIAITACKFSKFFRGSIPPGPPKAFLVA